MKPLLFISFTLLIFSSCSLDDEPQLINTNTPDTTKPYKRPPNTPKSVDISMKYFLFLKNSYWVYENELDNTIDCVYVTKSYEGARFSPSGPSMPRGGTHTYYYEIEYNSTLQGKRVEVLISDFIRKGIWDPNPASVIFEHGLEKNDTIFHGGGYYPILERYNQLSINDHTFKDVFKIKYKKDWYFDSDQIWHLSDSAGIVKREVLSNDMVVETWNLKRHHVEFKEYYD